MHFIATYLFCNCNCFFLSSTSSTNNGELLGYFIGIAIAVGIASAIVISQSNSMSVENERLRQEREYKKQQQTLQQQAQYQQQMQLRQQRQMEMQQYYRQQASTENCIYICSSCHNEFNGNKRKPKFCPKCGAASENISIRRGR